MSAVAELPVAPERKCRIEEVLSGSFIELIGLAPKNPYVRAIILAETGKMPAPECETPEQIKEWVEVTCDKKAVPPKRNQSGSDTAFSITVDFSETEYGRADYSVSRSGSDEFHVERDELMEIVETAIDNGESIDDVVQSISDKIHEDAWGQCDPNLDDYGDYDYSEHDSNDSGDCKEEFSTNQIRERLMFFLRENHPELAEQLQSD
jgi:hypothetical protein